MNNKYKIKIVGKNTKRFIKELIKEKIIIYYMETSDKESIIIVDDKGLDIINNKKTSYKINIIKEYGPIKYKNILKNNLVFFISIIIGISLLKLLSSMIFIIDIEHSKSEIRELIKNDLELYGIKKYHFKVNYKEKEEIKNKILKKETERIEWLEIEEIGTKYIVKVEERIKNNIKRDNNTQNIVAKKNAMILSINAIHGEIKKKKWDYVKKGEVLISGFITKDDKIMSKTKAIGTVYGEVWYKVNVEIPKKYKEVVKTGKSKYKIEFNFFSKSFFIIPNKYKNYKIKRRNILKNKIFPISINYSKLEETNVYKKNYYINNVDESAIKIGIDKLKTKLNKEDSVIYKKVLKKEEKNSKIIVDIFFKVKEDITDTENINNIDIEKIKEGEESESGN